jgi:hypothetical protein
MVFSLNLVTNKSHTTGKEFDMRALKKALSASLSLWTGEKPLPEHDPVCAKPRLMTGFLTTLTDEQKELARDYRGEETHGDRVYAQQPQR